MNLKTRLFAGAGALALVGSIAGIAIPASANAPVSTHTTTIADHCTGFQGVAGIKNTTTGLGLSNTLPPAGQVDKISIKSTAVGAMSCVGLLAALDGAIDPGSVKAGIVGAASCDTSLTPSIPPSGKLGWTAAGGTKKEQGYVRLAQLDVGPNYYQDVVGVHGMLTKGNGAGFDLDGSLYQNPTVKDKTLPTGFPNGVVWGNVTGYDTNSFDSAIIGQSCQGGASAGSLSLNDGTGVAAASPLITLTIVGDGTSLIESNPVIAPSLLGGPAPGSPCPCTTAQGLFVSAY